MSVVNEPSAIHRFVDQWTAGEAEVLVCDSRGDLGKIAAERIATEIRRVAQSQSNVRIIFAAAPSQTEVLEVLTSLPGIPWERVTAFHLDEYLGLESDAPQRFANWLDEHLFLKVPFGDVHRISSTAEPEDTCRNYAEKLAEAPIDIICLGIGVNGHIAFNDPPVADFDDPLSVKAVRLDDICRQQQVDDDCFDTFSEVPSRAITLTIPRIMAADTLFCVVPGKRKRAAVKAALEGPISTDCPASILKTHKGCTLFLDREANPHG